MANKILESVNLQSGTKVHAQNEVYEVCRELGEGGFASVFEIKNTKGHLLALKLTRLYSFMPEERTEYSVRFKQEYQYGKSLKSPFVVRSYDYGELMGNPFIVMDLCSEGSLRDLIKQKLSIDKINEIAQEILLGVDALHNEGIIHRDIKPENILFNSSRTAKLADFGISATVKKRHTQTNIMGHVKSVFATVTYCPPEQIDHKRAKKVMGPENDFYAFGAVMFELLTGGKLPFGDFEEWEKNSIGYERKKCNEQWNRQALIGTPGNSTWSKVIDKCLKFEPSQRYHQAEEVLKDLGLKSNQNGLHQKSLYPTSLWTLRIQNGDVIGRCFYLSNLQNNLNKNVLTIGWLNSTARFTNDLELPEIYTQYISRKHATLHYDIQTFSWEIEDGQIIKTNGAFKYKKSTNGTLVNGQKISERTRLEPNDIIQIGNTTLKVIVE